MQTGIEFGDRITITSGFSKRRRLAFSFFVLHKSRKVVKIELARQYPVLHPPIENFNSSFSGLPLSAHFPTAATFFKHPVKSRNTGRPVFRIPCKIPLSCYFSRHRTADTLYTIKTALIKRVCGIVACFYHFARAHAAAAPPLCRRSISSRSYGTR